MSDNTDLLEQPQADEIVDAPVSDALAEQAAPEPSENEVRARAMGWVPKEEFRGPAENWRDADEFVRRGEEELPILRERNKDLARKHAEFEARLLKQEQDFKDRIERQEKMAVAALRRQRAQLHEQYEAAKRSAVEFGDADRYDQLSRDQAQAVNQFDQQIEEAVKPDPARQQQAPQIPPDQQADVEVWTQQNPWFNTDPILNQYAQMVHMQLNATKPGMSLRDNLAEVAKDVRQRFPEKFGTQSRRPSAVESGGGLPTSSAKRAKGANDLPAEARAAAQEFVKEGIFKNVEEYAKEYFSQDGV